ncbi:hypothetical protein EDD11_008711 [Mortierella claussenii]|nr:hypothetical protein EDD11_008711 [Mortierella claussenii]
MSGYPSLQVFDETNSEGWCQISGLDSYFQKVHPGNWHPEDFERNTTYTNLDIFLGGLASISRTRLTSVSTYAKDILKYLSTPAGEEIKKKVLETMELRKLAQSNQLSYSKLQTEYSTENFDYLRNELKRKKQCVSTSASGSASAPATPTRVQSKRGRTSRRTTDSVAVPSPVTSDAVPISELSSSPRPRINDPWHDLVQATMSMYEGVDVELPSERCAVTERDPEKNALYKLALQHLQNAQAEMQKSKFDKTTCVDFKDAFVALSGLWNVFSNEANNAFQSADRLEVEELCRMTELENRRADISGILTTLAAKSQEVSLNDVVDHIYGLISTDPRFRPLLLTLIAIGEQGCAATTLSKSQLAKVFDTGAMARKCDCLFTVKGLEVGNVEAKRNSATKFEVGCQLRKNIKINKSILLQLEKYGVECPPLLSIHGHTAIVFRVRRWKNIFVASKACPTLVLPTTEDEWPLFLGEHAHVLSNLLEHYQTFSRNCAAAYSLVRYKQQATAEDDLVSLSYKEQAALLEWEHIVLHTPTKLKVNKKLLLKKPDNSLFWKKIDEADDDHGENDTVVDEELEEGK